MEEKGRYKIHRYTLQGNEKISLNDYIEHICERYDFGFEKIEPFNRRIQDLLNQQDKRIKELELLLKADKKIETNSLNGFEKLRKENQQLKQSQNQVAISELEKIYNLFEPYENYQKDTILCANNGISFVDYLENQIKSLKGEE